MFRISRAIVHEQPLAAHDGYVQLDDFFGTAGPQAKAPIKLALRRPHGAAHVPGAVRAAKLARCLEPKNWIGSRRCSSRQGGRGRGSRTPAYSCGRERWRYCIACLSCTHFSFAGVQGSRA